MPLLREGGELLAMKGERAQEELDAARPQLKTFGVRDVELVTVGRGRVEPPATLVRVVAGRSPRTDTRRQRKR